MEAKEKAIELFQKFDSILLATFICDEIIEAVIDASHKTSGSHNYWLEVKKEIDLL